MSGEDGGSRDSRLEAGWARTGGSPLFRWVGMAVLLGLFWFAVLWLMGFLPR